jgi:hypothetical protein
VSYINHPITSVRIGLNLESFSLVEEKLNRRSPHPPLTPRTPKFLLLGNPAVLTGPKLNVGSFQGLYNFSLQQRESSIHNADTSPRQLLHGAILRLNQPALAVLHSTPRPLTCLFPHMALKTDKHAPRRISALLLLLKVLWNDFAPVQPLATD